MVRVVRPPPLLLPPLLSPPPPQAATPRARAVMRQPAAATERTRKGPSSGTRYRRPGILCAPEDAAQCPTCTAALTVNEVRPRRSARDGRSGAPVARHVRREHAQRHRHEGDQHREHEGVERLDADGPEDEPEDEAER